MSETDGVAKDWLTLVGLFESLGVADDISAKHRNDGEGRCTGCTLSGRVTVKYPCTLAQLSDAALRHRARKLRMSTLEII